MSIVGYILGLGDRHLDNILVDFSSGDIVHIDYNVCFDKGLRLKIPEIVPFRLTHTIQAALGLTGVEGIFRGNCEAVLEALKRNKDVILMLLQVFVWDPLVEWMRGDGHDEAAIGGEERKGMELAVSLSLFASRVQEIRVPLQVLFISSCGSQIVDKHDHSYGVQIMKNKGVFC
jgi:PI-3-kinase-related kinase SMG-1